MRTLNLTPQDKAPEAAEAAKGLAGELYARNEQAAPIATQKALTPREVELRVRLRNPATGNVDTVVLKSRAPDAACRRDIINTAAGLHRGVPAVELGPVDALYINSIARIVCQCEKLRPEDQWLLDDVRAVCEIGGALVEHDQRYFLGDDGPGDGGPHEPVVERPWAKPSAG